VVSGIIDSNPNVDFGLMVFNTNGSSGPHGGRVAQGIKENMTDAQRIALKSTVANIRAETWTPLCETMYEAYRYFSGGAVYYGDDMSSATPARDTSAESSGSYISPMGDCQQVYVILMTDGEPTNDTAADSLIGNLSNIGSFNGNRLDELAGWLYSNDLDNDDTNGVQRVVTYTIGFTIDQALLSDTARKGGGRYYTANDSAALTNSFQGAINEILITDTTFTSPAVAVNSFNRSRSLDDVYIAMFRPEAGPRWHGNLKKLSIDGTGTINDANGNPAIDPTTGNIRDTAQTFWSASSDGGRVQNGGAGELLANRNSSTRVIKVDSGTGGVLEDFAITNSHLTAADFSVADDAAKNEMINWARGVDVDDEDIDGSSIDTRPWLIGDPLHSQPLVINYGARGTYTAANPDIRIVMGTNHGVLHMFGADDGHEDWAFMPKQLLPLNKVLRENAGSSSHPYGIDGSVAVYMQDVNYDGTITGGDKVYIYFGLRRGGSAYYAMDVSNPDAPAFMWRIDDTGSGFSELGQSWSVPTITKIPGHSNPVLVIGGGYDTNKDAHAVGADDSVGRGIFIIDAINGDLVWSITPAANSSANLRHAGLVDSIPAPVSGYDSNGDGLTDRLYAADTGGNIWRVDMPGNSLPGASQTTWSIFKMAELGGAIAADDRRFFNKVDVVRTRYGSLAYDGLAIGSGNRAHPNETSVDDRFYMIRDTAVVSAYHGSGGVAVPSAFSHSDLYNATANLIQQGDAGEKSTALSDLASKHGWYIDLEKSGEKSLSSSLTLDGTVYFTSFAPDSSATSCVPVPGYGYLYAINLHEGSAVFDWDATSADLTKGDRDTSVGGRLPDTVTPYFDDTTIRIIGVGAGDEGKGSYDTGGSLETQGTYWYKETD
jgi:type IV pilus assembly protein PilY1